MKSRTLMCVSAMALFAALALPVRLAAQHTHYKLIDLGTLGGINSYQVSPGQTVNNRGEVIAFADTDVPDPFAPNCLQSVDCHIAHAIKWYKGVTTDLGALPGVNDSIALWITPGGGLIAGASENGEVDPLTGTPEVRAVFWNEDGSIKDLGTLGGNSSQAFSINSRGQVVGVALNPIPDPFAQVMNFLPAATQARAFLWQDGSMQDLGTLGGNDADAQIVNERGQAMGFSFTDITPNATTLIPTLHPFLWENGSMRDLGTLGGTFAMPVSLNARGEVAGFSTLEGDQAQHPFLWDGRELKDLGTLGGDFGFVGGMNDAGVVVGGTATAGDLGFHAVLWKDGVMLDLGLPANGDLCDFADSVNSRNQVVGESDCNGGLGHAFLWENGGPAVDLSTLVVDSDVQVFGVAFINDRGEIAGIGVLPNGETRAVLLIPITGTETTAGTATTPGTHGTQRDPVRKEMDAWRARLAKCYRIRGLGASPRD
jgi:probable HAF family extracellular repeat protein